jgi:hypothetical protein
VKNGRQVTQFSENRMFMLSQTPFFFKNKSSNRPQKPINWNTFAFLAKPFCLVCLYLWICAVTLIHENDFHLQILAAPAPEIDHVRVP